MERTKASIDLVSVPSTISKEDRARDYYMLKANLEDAYVDGEGKLVVVFSKWNDPQLSARTLRGMRGFLVVHFKKA